jgi:methionyl-tRNA formyltransferase
LITLIVSLAQSGGLLLGETLADIEQKKYILLSQNENNATYDHKLKKEDGKIIWTNSAEKINNLVRGTLGWPSAYTDYKNVLIKIIQADVIEEAANEQPGTVSKVDKQGIYVCTGKNILRIIKVKPEGKNEMPAWAFVCGHKLQPGDRFD